jgi:hypothetical protein
MNKTLKLGSFAGLKILAKPTALIATIVLWLVFTLIGRKVFKLSTKQAILGGFIATEIHWVSELWHHFGHAQAAKQVGYPMSGICANGPIAASLYPPDEPTLPGPTHIKRALGGPIASGALALVMAILTIALRPIGGIPLMAASLAFFENLFVLSLGAFLPLGFTDGSTILHYWNRSPTPSRWVTISE